MKVPQTFTITIEQAGFLAQMKSGQRSSWIRAAIDNYRKGPIALEERTRRWVACANRLQQYIWDLGEEHNEAVWEIMSDALGIESEQASKERAKIAGNKVSETSDE